MELSLECVCGEEITGSTRGEERAADLRIPCEGCGAMYAISLTRLRPVNAETE